MLVPKEKAEREEPKYKNNSVIPNYIHGFKKKTRIESSIVKARA